MDLEGLDISDSWDPIFFDFRDPMIIFSDSNSFFSILGTRIGSLKHLKKLILSPLRNSSIEECEKYIDLKYVKISADKK